MQKRKLGNSPLEVAPLAFGGNVFGWTVDEATAFKLLDAFVGAGLNGGAEIRQRLAWKWDLAIRDYPSLTSCAPRDARASGAGLAHCTSQCFRADRECNQPGAAKRPHWRDHARARSRSARTAESSERLVATLGRSARCESFDYKCLAKFLPANRNPPDWKRA